MNEARKRRAKRSILPYVDTLLQTSPSDAFDLIIIPAIRSAVHCAREHIGEVEAAIERMITNSRSSATPKQLTQMRSHLETLRRRRAG
jgi:hypothetical protein